MVSRSQRRIGKGYALQVHLATDDNCVFRSSKLVYLPWNVSVIPSCEKTSAYEFQADCVYLIVHIWSKHVDRNGLVFLYKTHRDMGYICACLNR
jgi:hypothetical protein